MDRGSGTPPSWRPRTQSGKEKCEPRGRLEVISKEQLMAQRWTAGPLTYIRGTFFYSLHHLSHPFSVKSEKSALHSDINLCVT